MRDILPRIKYVKAQTFGIRTRNRSSHGLIKSCITGQIRQTYRIFTQFTGTGDTAREISVRKKSRPG